MTAAFIGLIGGAFVMGWALTGAARRYALGRGILDTPNERSAHVVPTPLGGGWGIAIPAIGVVMLACALGWLDRGPAWGLGVGGFAVALVGWIDDHG